MNNSDSPITANPAKRTRRNTSPNITQTQSPPLASSLNSENSIVLTDIDLVTVFEKDISSTAISFVKITFAIMNYMQKITVKQDCINSKIWPNHIKSKIKDLEEPFCTQYASKILRNEISLLKDKSLQLDEKRKALTVSLFTKLKDDLDICFDDPIKNQHSLDYYKQMILLELERFKLTYISRFTLNEAKTKSKREKRLATKKNNYISHTEQSSDTSKGIKQLILKEVKKLTNKKKKKNVSKPKRQKTFTKNSKNLEKRNEPPKNPNNHKDKKIYPKDKHAKPKNSKRSSKKDF